MANKCVKCGYENEDSALSCNLCAEVLRKEKPSSVEIVRGSARFGRHASLPFELARRLSALAMAMPGLKAVYLFTMSVDGGPPLSAFGFAADGPEGMREAHVFLQQADPHMPAELISKDLQCMPMDDEFRAEMKRISIAILDR
jgi:hypothetical protein